MGGVTIGVDAHVLTGKFQGTRTTLTSLLRAAGALIGDYRLIVYTNDPDAARAAIGVDAFHYERLTAQSSLKRLLREFPRLFRRDRVDLGVFQYIAPLTGRHVLFVHDILPLSHPHLFPWRNRLRTWFFYTPSIRRAAIVLVVSEDTRGHLQRRFRLPDHRIRTVLNGPSFPPQAYAGDPAPAPDRYILTVGRIEARKNVPLLIDAVLRANVPGVRLVVVGATDLGFDFRPPDDPRIEIRQGVSEDALVKLYRGASLFVYPSAAEGFGMPLLDATLFGLPVISSNRTAMPEVGGDLVRYFDPEASDARDRLAAMIAGHFGGEPIPALTPDQRAGQAERFSWDRAARDFLAAVKAAMGRLS